MLIAVGMDVQWRRLHGCLYRQDLTIYTWLSKSSLYSWRFYKSMLKPDFLHKTYLITCCICQTWCMSLAIQWILLIKIFQNYFTNLLYLQIFNTNVAFGFVFWKAKLFISFGICLAPLRVKKIMNLFDHVLVEGRNVFLYLSSNWFNGFSSWLYKFYYKTWSIYKLGYHFSTIPALFL